MDSTITPLLKSIIKVGNEHNPYRVFTDGSPIYNNLKKI